jgi:hypothetical protein
MSSSFVTIFAKHSVRALSNASSYFCKSISNFEFFYSEKIDLWDCLDFCVLVLSFPRNNFLYACRFFVMSSRKAGTA